MIRFWFTLESCVTFVSFKGYYFLHDFSLFEGILPKYYPRGDFVIKTIFQAVQDKQLVMFVKLTFFGEILQV